MSAEAFRLAKRMKLPIEGLGGISRDSSFQSRDPIGSIWVRVANATFMERQIA